MIFTFLYIVSIAVDLYLAGWEWRVTSTRGRQSHAGHVPGGFDQSIAMGRPV